MSSITLHRMGLLAASLTELVQQASATDDDAGTTIDAPADIEAGDLLVLLDSASAVSTPDTAVPSGFTSIVNTENAGQTSRQIASYKIADGTEASATLTGMDSGPKILLTFRGNIPIMSVTPFSENGEITTGNPSAQNVAASSATPPLVVFGCYRSFGAGGAVDPRTFTPAKDGEESSLSGRLYFAWKIYNENPADVTIDMDDEGVNGLQSFGLSCE